MEFDVVKKPHPDHPLILYQQGKPDGDREAWCSKCGQPWRPPAFGCSECSFVIHQSCLDLPHETHTPFHPHHKLLSLTTNNSNYLCNCCGQMAFGDVYRCPECGFQMDVQCAIADTKAASGIIEMKTSGNFRHFSHPHPLTLVQYQKQRGKERGACLVCGWPIDSGSSAYFCCLCNSHFHRQCAEMQREILKLDYHPHPLFLFASTWTNNDNDDTRCDNCINDCKNGGFFYSCVMCNFNLHLPCLSSFKHQHTFEHVKKDKNKRIPYDSVCPLCRRSSGKEDGDWFCCSECNLLAHGECVELPILQTSQHHHSLALTYRLDYSTYNNICRICGREMGTRCGGYVCQECSYVSHLQCAKRCIQMEGQNNSIIPIPSGIGIGIEPHFSGHEHKLSLCAFEDDRHCNGCMQSISTQSYGCPPCGFYLHQECASLPRQHTNSLLHPHELSLLYVPNFVFSCACCRQYCHGFAYHCEQCHYTIDIRCVVLTLFPFTHPSHPHSLLPIRCREPTSLRNIPRCDCCKQDVRSNLVFGCNDCQFYLDTRCAHLPLAARNRFDEHPLSLTFRTRNNNQYQYCDICEDENGAISKRWFYSCKLCSFDAHVNCVLGDYPFLKSAQFQGHRHPLSLFQHGNKGRSPCGQCGKSCQGNLAFQCGDVTCNFTLHAFGLCYQNQLTQGTITFTMPSLRYRSLPLYLDPIQRKRSEFILLGRHGRRGGSTWNERALLAIRQFMVNYERWDDSIQIQYDENEKSFWSTSHGELDGDYSNSKVSLNSSSKLVSSILLVELDSSFD